MPTINPISMLASMGPAESNNTSTKPSRRMRVIASALIAFSSCVTQDQSAHDQEPAIYKHEKQKFERQRNHRRREHLHPHCKQNICDHHINHDEGHKQ